jgi:serine/threonine-protein kinase HipA
MKCLYCYQPLKPGATQEYHEKCSKKIFGRSKAPELAYDMGEINELAKEVINRRLAIPGVQPKLSLMLDKSDKNNPGDRLTIVGLWDGMYVLKPANPQYRELPENEDVTMHMAEACGIKTAIHSVVRFKSGELAYISKRFDRLVKRAKVEKLHTEDMCQLTGLLTEDKYNSSMEKVAKAVNQYTDNKGLELLALFQISVFSFLTGNSDMHLKNFSLLKDKNGGIALSPAYDLLATKLVVPDDQEQLALSLNGKKNKIGKADFLKFAEYCKIPSKAAENIFSDFGKKMAVMKSWLEMSFLSRDLQEAYLAILAERASSLLIELPPDFTELSVGE